MKISEWSVTVLLALASGVLTIAAAVFTGAFLVEGFVRILAFTIAGVLAVLAGILFWRAANRDHPEEPRPGGQVASEPKPGVVDKRSKSLAKNPNEVGRKRIPRPFWRPR